MKMCRTCKTEKPNSKFYGKSTQCKSCSKVYSKLYYRANKSKVLARRKAKYDRDRSGMKIVIRKLETMLELRSAIQKEIRPDNVARVSSIDRHYREYVGLLEFDAGLIIGDMQKAYEDITK